jgi:hypothetical protein
LFAPKLNHLSTSTNFQIIFEGNPIPDEIFSGGDATFTEDITASAEQVKHVIEDSKKLLLPDPAECVGAWGLIDADQGY